PTRREVRPPSAALSIPSWLPPGRFIVPEAMSAGYRRPASVAWIKRQRHPDLRPSVPRRAHVKEMRRRDFIPLLGGAVNSPLSAFCVRAARDDQDRISQRKGARPVCSILLMQIRSGLKEADYVEGQSVAIPGASFKVLDRLTCRLCGRLSLS